MIEIPACADRVEITGQAQRLAPIGSEAARFELDHTFDLMFTRTQLSFQGGGGVETFVVESNQPDPLRMFLGIGAVVGGALIAGSAANDVAGGAHPLADRPLALGIAGGALIATGAAAAMTGWRPSRSYVTFPESACPDPRSSRGATGPAVYER